jgi:hypothetical protein
MKKQKMLLAALFVFLSSSCSFNPESLLASFLNSSAQTSQASSLTSATDEVIVQSNEEISYGEEYITHHLGDYWLTYSFTSKSNGVAQDPVLISVARNQEGYYYKDNTGGEALFLKNGALYDIYTPNDQGQLEKVSGIQYEKESVEGFTSSFLNFMTIYEISKTDLVSDGSETIAGRLCDKYVYHSSFVDSAVDLKYSIDKETGVCLRYNTQVLSGKDTGAFEFLATVFKTSGVTLPSHI